MVLTYKISMSFALKTEGTPLGLVRCIEDYDNTFGDSWDAILFRKNRERDAAAFFLHQKISDQAGLSGPVQEKSSVARYMAKNV